MWDETVSLHCLFPCTAKGFHFGAHREDSVFVPAFVHVVYSGGESEQLLHPEERTPFNFFLLFSLTHSLFSRLLCLFFASLLSSLLDI